MEQYRTEEEQVEALKRWWDENGRSTIAAIIVALGLGFGWQGWQQYQQGQLGEASSIYHSLLRDISEGDELSAMMTAGEVKSEYPRSIYAQFAAMHLARLAVLKEDLSTAEGELRWVLGRAASGSDTMLLAQLRLARVLAAQGDTGQALAIIESADPGSYGAAYQMARGDILLMEGQNEAAREAYDSAMALAASSEQGQVNLATLEQKLQSLSLRELPAQAAVAVPAVEVPQGDQ